MATPTIPAANSISVGQKTGVAQILNQIIAAIRYMLSDSGNPYPIFRNVNVVFSSDSGGNATLSYPAFPNAQSGAPVVVPSGSYGFRCQPTASTNGTVTINATTLAGGPLGAVSNLSANIMVGGN